MVTTIHQNHQSTWIDDYMLANAGLQSAIYTYVSISMNFNLHDRQMGVSAKVKVSDEKEQVHIHTRRTTGVSKIRRDKLKATPVLVFVGIRLITALMPKLFKPTQCLGSSGIKAARDKSAFITTFIGA